MLGEYEKLTYYTGCSEYMCILKLKQLNIQLSTPILDLIDIESLCNVVQTCNYAAFYIDYRSNWYRRSHIINKIITISLSIPDGFEPV